MQTPLTDHYINWLKKFRSTHETNKTAVRLSTTLIAGMEQIESLEQLILLLSQYISNRQNQSSIHPLQENERENIPYYEPINYYTQLSSWLDTLIQINKNTIEIKSAMQNITITPQNSSLIRFLNDLLNEPKAVLNNRILSLLHVLSSDSLEVLLNYLSELKIATYPENPRPGDFAALEIINPDHKACLYIFNNLLKSYDNANLLCNLGNTLLQSALLIFRDVHMKKSSIEDEESYTQLPKVSTCALI